MVLEGKERSRGHYTLILCRDISRQNLLCFSEILHKAEWKFKGQKLCADKMDALMPLPLSERLILAFHINGISHLSTFLQRYNSSKCHNSWLRTTNDCDGEALTFFSWFGVFTGGHHLSYVNQWCCLVWVQGEPLDHLFSHSHCHFRAHRARHHWALQAHGRCSKFPPVDSLCSIFRIKIPKKTKK